MSDRNGGDSSETLPTLIAGGGQFKDHFLRQRPLLEKAIGRRVASWSADQGEEFVAELKRLIASGMLHYQGKHTVAKGEPWVHIYRGQGLTLVQKQSGEFQALWTTGEGRDLALRPWP